VRHSGTTGDPIPEFRAQLRKLHTQAGQPSYEELQRHANLLGRNLPTSTTNDLLNGKSVPRWKTVETFLLA
jgi:hypothetical protein